MSFPIGSHKLLPLLASMSNTYSPNLSTLDLSVDGSWVFLFISNSCSTSGITLSVSGTGWTEITEGNAIANNPKVGLYKCQVSGGTVADPTFTLSSSATGQWLCTGWVEDDTDATDPVDNVSVHDVAANYSTLSTPSLTTSTAGCRIVYCATGRASSGTSYVRFDEEEGVTVESYQTWFDSTVDSIGISQVTASTVFDSTGSSPQKTAYNYATVRLVIIAVAIKNKSGGSRYTTADTGYQRLAWLGTFGNVYDASMTPAVSSVTGNPTSRTINGITVSTTAATRSVSNPAGVWNGNDTYTTTAIASSIWQGNKITFSADLPDFTDNWFTVEFGAALPSGWAAEGFIVVFEDNGETNWKAFQLSQRFNMAAAKTYTAIIDFDGTPYDSGGSLSATAVRKITFLGHKQTSTTLRSFYVYHLGLLGKTTIHGGGVNYPLEPNFLRKVLCGGLYAELVGGEAPAITIRSGLQIGDGGTTDTYFDATGTLTTFPEQYDGNAQRTIQVGANKIDVTILAGSTDTINLTATAISAPASNHQNFSVDVSSDTGADYSLVGGAFINLQWANNIAIPYSGASFSGCELIDVGGSTVSNLAVAKPTGTSAITESLDGVVLSGSETDVGTTAPADYHIALGSAVNTITLTNHTFTNTAAVDKIYTAKTAGTVTAGSFVTGESYEIKTVGTTDFTAIGASANTIGVQFTASGAGSGSGDAYKALKIIKTGTTSLLDTDVTTVDGVKVWVAGDVVTQSVTITGLTSGSRVQIYDTTAATELANSTQASPGSNVTWTSATTMTWTDPVAAAADRTIRVRIAYVSGTSAKGFIEASIGTCGITDGTEVVSYLANQVDDAVYNANGIDGPSIYATSGITFTDSGSNDRINCNIGGGAVSWGTIYACFAYWMSTSTGIADDIAYVTAVDTANYLLDSLKVKNTSTTPLTITGGWGRDATSLTIADCIDTAGSTGNIFPQPDHVVAYATGSGSLTAGDITNIWSNGSRTLTTTIPSAATISNQIFTDAATTPIAANIKQVNDLTVAGTGTTEDPWRP